MIVWKSSELAINEDKILHFLGYQPSQTKQPNKRIIKMIRQEQEYAQPLINARGIYKIEPAPQYDDKEIFADADSLAFGLVTVGEKLENAVQQLFAKGLGTRAVILDAIGSVAAEAAADLLNKQMEITYTPRFPFITRRFSPGYGCWDVSGQELVFANLGGAQHKLGVSLSGSMLMKPLKSVSFVVKLGRRPLKEINEGTCTYCRQKHACNQKNSGHLCSIAMAR